MKSNWTRKFWLVALIICTLTGSALLYSPVSAGVECRPRGCADDCFPYPEGKTERGSDYRKCCCANTSCTTGNVDCHAKSWCECGNCEWFAEVEDCPCTPVTCPPGVPGNKFMTNTMPGGQSRTCNDPCKPVVNDCPSTSANTPPICSMLPKNIEMNRTDTPKQLELTVTDNDYGDTVQLTGARTVDAVGDLNSCVKVQTIGGGGIYNLVVKTGSNDPGDITQTTTLLVDSRGQHGVFENVGGQSLCSGKLELELRDVDSDAEGPDVSETVTCSINISVKNEFPKLSNVAIYDRDSLTELRELNGTGNLIDGRTKLFVGSTLTSANESRASKCSGPLTLIANPISCQPPLGENVFDAQFSRKRNPLLLEFTVTDANGREDIMQAGFWVQRLTSVKSAETPVLPYSGNSFQAMYTEKENMQVDTTSSRWNFVSRACLDQSCGPQTLHTSSKLIFSGLGFINSLGTQVSINGNVKQGKTQWASSKDWQKAGFPDCLEQTAGCVAKNVPSSAKLNATTNNALWVNYEWAVASDQDHLLCFKPNSSVPTVVSPAVSVVCPKTCAACIKQEGVNPVQGNVNALRFSASLYINDRDAVDGVGMPDGSYAIFLSALDKVSAPLHNVKGKGDDGWVRFNKEGNVCTGTTCDPGEDFVLVYDSVPPTIAFEEMDSGSLEAEITVKAEIADSTSGVAGITNRYVAYQSAVGGEPEGEIYFAEKMSGAAFNGKNDQIPTTGNALTINAKGIPSSSAVLVGACVYDAAGNMRCAKNEVEHITESPWLKTTYGDIYSGVGAALPFNLSLPSDVDGNKDETSGPLINPFADQIFTVGTGLLLTSGPSIGLTGGHDLAGPNNATLGFKNNYRTGGSAFNVFRYSPHMVGDEFGRLDALARSNCLDINEASGINSTCVVDGALGSAPYTIKTVGTDTWSNTVCAQVSVIFVTGTLTVHQVTKSTTKANSGCLFVVAAGAKLIVSDNPSDIRTYSAAHPPDEPGTPHADKFEAAVIVASGGNIEFSFGEAGATTHSTDRLSLLGWVYSASTMPAFKRNLAAVDDKRYPAELLRYDAHLLDVFRPIIGTSKTADLTCGTSNHVLCK